MVADGLRLEVSDDVARALHDIEPGAELALTRNGTVVAFARPAQPDGRECDPTRMARLKAIQDLLDYRRRNPAGLTRAEILEITRSDRDRDG